MTALLPKILQVKKHILIFAALITACFCSSCSCCYCDLLCKCSNGSDNKSYEYHDSSLLNVFGVPLGTCSDIDECKNVCANNYKENYRDYVSTTDIGFGCYPSSCSLFSSSGDPRLVAFFRFRDEVLAQSKAGRAVVDFYYGHEEEMIQFLEEHPGVQKLVSKLIDLIYPFIEKKVAEQAQT